MTSPLVQALDVKAVSCKYDKTRQKMKTNLNSDPPAVKKKVAEKKRSSMSLLMSICLDDNANVRVREPIGLIRSRSHQNGVA